MTLASKLDDFPGLYLLEKQRISSFKEWPFDDASSCSKLKMAQAGFYWCGSKTEPDTVSCFVCNKTLDGWEVTDDPWKEHAKHAPQCQFVKYGRPQSEMTVGQFLEIFAIVFKNDSQRHAQRFKHALTLLGENKLKMFSDKRK